MNTFTEENYLKAIYKLGLTIDIINTNALAAELGTKAASVTDMIKRLSNKKLVVYKPYQGVKLTDIGKKLAVDIVRKHRLWEVFLVNKLHFKWDEVHDIAEQLEHIQSKELIDRLDLFLDKPAFDPHGDPIPDANGKFQQYKFSKLSEIKPNQKSSVVGVLNHSSTFLQFLEKSGIELGSEIVVKEVTDFDKSLQIIINKKQKFFLSSEVANHILVS